MKLQEITQYMCLRRTVLGNVYYRKERGRERIGRKGKTKDT